MKGFVEVTETDEFIDKLKDYVQIRQDWIDGYVVSKKEVG